VTPVDVEDLMGWNVDPYSSWGIAIDFSEPRAARISPPLDHTGSKTLDQGEQLVFARQFDGRPGEKHYYEILQKFTHIFGIHFMEERQAYCRLDERGDLEDMIRIVETPGKGEAFATNAVVFNRVLLDQYLCLTDSVLVRMFDFTRYLPGHFNGWRDGHDSQFRSDGDLHYRLHVEPGYGSYARGFQIVCPLATKEEVSRSFDYRKEEQQYASFIAQDWKNKVIREISCAPGQTANYFRPSDLPFETSPAFFRPEVLLKYKADSEKYRLAGRSISCRGGWSLQTYDINDAGQVHTYLVYLGNLPFQEQLYWKSYNEAPKGSISDRAFTTDFEGNWDLEYDPLNSINVIVGDLHSDQVPWWTLRSEGLREQLHYPVTSSADEWANEILHLDQLIVEGFETRWLRSKAQSMGRVPNVSFGSLRLVEECLIALGVGEDDAKDTVAPLKETHHLRSKVKGHASGKEAAAIRKQILKEHGAYKEHFRVLSKRCDESIRTIAKVFQDTDLGAPTDSARDDAWGGGTDSSDESGAKHC
jgi:hypothetical protein